MANLHMVFLKLTQLGDDNDRIVININHIVYIEESTEYNCSRIAITNGNGENMIISVKESIDTIGALINEIRKYTYDRESF